jgi:hypothetical protein
VGKNQVSAFDYPGYTPMVGDDKKPTLAWEAVFTRWQMIIAAEQQSGTTANRPTADLWIGRRFYDTTLNQPVYVASVKPTVWRDAMANVV